MRVVPLAMHLDSALAHRSTGSGRVYQAELDSLRRGAVHPEGGHSRGGGTGAELTAKRRDTHGPDRTGQRRLGFDGGVYTPSPQDEYETDPDLVIDMRDVSVRRGQNVLLHDISWQVELDERWVVLGRNGAGKTTMLQLAAAQMHPTDGAVHVLGERIGRVDLFELRPRIGLASAAIGSRVPPQEKVIDIVQSAGYAVIGRWREQYDSMDTDRALELLEHWGVSRLADREFGTLSEGERKRTQICRALMTDPELLLLDEPAAGLDLAGREDLLGRLSEFAADPIAPAMVLVTHHVEEIPRGFTHLMMLRDGGIVRRGLLEQEMSEQAIKDTFGLDVYLTQRRGRYFASIG